MNRRTFLKLSCVSTLPGILPLAVSEAKPTGKKPNIILIILDDAGYSDFGFTGCKEIATPNIDSIAREGTICKQGYVTASVCCPSRMGLFTGRYQQRFGAECNCPAIPTPGFDKASLGMDTSEKTIADDLRNAGYRTMMIGKWHLGHEEQYHPNKRGFDEFYGFLEGSRSYWPQKKIDRHYAILRNDERVDEVKHITYTTDDFTDEGITFIKRNKNKPFFLCLSYNAVHTPMHAKEEDIEQCSEISPKNRRLYAAMTKSADENIGRVLETLKQNNIEDNTLIVFVNDNGGAGNNASRNNPLRGGKGSYWEGGIRVPFAIKWPGKIPSGRQYDHPVSTLDLLPTFLGASGARHIGKPLDGKNLLSYLNGENKNAPHEYLFWRLWRVSAVRSGDWKLIKVAENALKGNRRNFLPLILVNLKDDPYETKNVAESHPEKLKQLVKSLTDWEETLSEPRWYDGVTWKKWAEYQIRNHKI